jgi:hypothetical protein
MGDSYLFWFGGIEQFFEQGAEADHGLPQVFRGRLPLYDSRQIPWVDRKRPRNAASACLLTSGFVYTMLDMQKRVRSNLVPAQRTRRENQGLSLIVPANDSKLSEQN